MTSSLLHPTPPHQQRLNEAIRDAHRRGDDGHVDALLVAKLTLIRREAGGATATPNGWSLRKGGA